MASTSISKPATDLVLLDTNVLIIYAREGEPAKRLETLLGLQGGSVDAVISLVSIGEALAFAKKNGWGEKRQTTLRDLIRNRIIPIDISRPEILAAYADLDHYCEKVLKPARPMGKNDLWIAATARVLNCTLVTTDTDFDHLHGRMLQRRWINPSTLKPDPPATSKSGE